MPQIQPEGTAGKGKGKGLSGVVLAGIAVGVIVTVGVVVGVIFGTRPCSVFSCSADDDGGPSNSAPSTSPTSSPTSNPTTISCEEMENATRWGSDQRLWFRNCYRQVPGSAAEDCADACDRLYDLQTCSGTDSPTFTDAQVGVSCSSWAELCSLQNNIVGHADVYVQDCSEYVETTFYVASLSHAGRVQTVCENGGLMAGTYSTGNLFYSKSTMDDVRANCPVACHTCADD